MSVKSPSKRDAAKTSLRYPGLQYQPDQGENRSWLFRLIRGFLRSQFGQPKGFWGVITGKIMAFTPSNRERIHWTVSMLNIRPDDRVLEIGFGPGYAVDLVSRTAVNGVVAGVDHSEVMVRQASNRNARAIRDGRVDLRLGTASELPKFSEPFDKVFTINSIHFWNDPVDCLGKMRELLKPGGLIAVTLQPRSRNATDATTKEIGEEVAANLARAGFSQVRLEFRKMEPVSVACALGVR